MFKFNKQAQAIAHANKQSITDSMDRATKSVGGQNLKPLVGNHELVGLGFRNFGDDDKHASISFTIDGTPVRADLVFWNLNSEKVNQRTITSFCNAMAILGISGSVEEGFDLGDDGSHIKGKKASGIILATGKNNDYLNYSLISLSKSGSGSSTEWLKSQWAWNVQGVNSDGEVVNDSPFYSFCDGDADLLGCYLETAYDYEGVSESPIDEPEDVPAKPAKVKGKLSTDDMDDDVPF